MQGILFSKRDEEAAQHHQTSVPITHSSHAKHKYAIYRNMLSPLELCKVCELSSLLGKHLIIILGSRCLHAGEKPRLVILFSSLTCGNAQFSSTCHALSSA